jgi:hypothetical protein
MSAEYTRITFSSSSFRGSGLPNLSHAARAYAAIDDMRTGGLVHAMMKRPADPVSDREMDGESQSLVFLSSSRVCCINKNNLYIQ